MQNNCYGEQLTLISAVAAIELARGKTPEEINLLSGFFVALGDQLALLLAGKEVCEASETAEL